MRDDNTQDGAEPSSASAGSQPVAWAVTPGTLLAGRAWRVTLDKDEAERISCGAMLVVPLYERPQALLTAEERDAVRWAGNMIPSMAHKGAAVAYCHAETLRKLDERLG